MYQKTLATFALALPLVTGCVPVMIAGTAATVSLTNDPRTAGAVVDDQTIEFKVLHNISESSYYADSHISIVSYNAQVLLLGQIIDEVGKEDLTRRAATVPNVRKVFNELTVGKNVSLTTRANDSLITGEIKTKMLTNSTMARTRVKVVTENGIVYLMGIVNEDEALLATQLAEKIKGVKKIIRLFEYTNGAASEPQSPSKTHGHVATGFEADEH